jgi:hypothetical protein
MRTEGIAVTVEATLLGRLDRANGPAADGAGVGRRAGPRR